MNTRLNQVDALARADCASSGRRRFLAGLLSIPLGCAAQSGGGKSSASVADFALREVAGHTVRLSDFIGANVVLLNFWATWCASCLAELPHLNRLYKFHNARGFVVLSIVMDGPETLADVAPLVRRHDLAFPVLLDEETRVVGVYNPKRTAPFNVLIGRDALVAKCREGFAPGDERALEADIAALLARG